MKNDLIYLVESTLRSTLNKEYTGKKAENLTKIYDELVKYYFLYDKLHNTCHNSVIKELYKTKKKTYLSKSLDLYISEKTLFNYRKEYCENWINILFYHKSELRIGKKFTDLFKDKLL